LNVAPAVPAPEPEAPAPMQTVSEANLQAMVDLGVMQSPNYWQRQNISRLANLFDNASLPDKLDSRIDNGITDTATALKVLEDAGIESNPGHWQELLDGDDISPWLGPLLINIANRALDPLHRIVWAEARGEDLKGQVLVVNVVINRHNSPQFATGIYNVLHQERQFTPITNGAYARATPTEMQRQAVNMALDGADYSQGALFFRTVAGAEGSWHQTALTQVLEHGNHRFYV